MCGVIISDRSALEISSRGSSKLTSEFSASEIFVQRLPGSSVTSLRRRQSGGDSALPPPIAPTKMALSRGRDDSHMPGPLCLSVTLLISQRQGWGQCCWLALVLTAKLQTRQRRESNPCWPERDFQPLGHPPDPGVRRDKTSPLSATHRHRANYWRPIQAEEKNKHTPVPSIMALFNTHLWSDGNSSWTVQVIYGIFMSYGRWTRRGWLDLRQHLDWWVPKDL